MLERLAPDQLMECVKRGIKVNFIKLRQKSQLTRWEYPYVGRYATSIYNIHHLWDMLYHPQDNVQNMLFGRMLKKNESEKRKAFDDATIETLMKDISRIVKVII